MERMLERCCALDVHKKQVTACVHVPDQEGKRSELRAEFSTMTAELLALRDWLQGLGVTHVAMESTGVYWKPVYYLLEDDFELLLVNAQHVKQVPGRKTDVKDAQWLCQLLEHGLLRRELRAAQADPRAARPDPLPQVAHLRSARARPTGSRRRWRTPTSSSRGWPATCSARPGAAMLAALCEGNDDPEALAELAKGKLRRKAAGAAAGAGGPLLEPHHALLVSHLLAHIDYLDETIGALSAEIEERAAPFRA